MANPRQTARQSEPTETPGGFSRKRSAVIGAAFVAMLFAGASGWFAISAMSKETTTMNLLPIRAVTFVGAAGELKRVDADELKRIAGAIQNMGGSMLHTDLNQVKAAVKQVEWVRDAEVRRRFPSTLEVHIEEHLPFARWQIAGDAEQSFLVNTFGEVFEAELEDASPVLPIFSGPKDSAREVMASYQAFGAQLSTIEQRPVEVRLSPRRAWQVKLENGSTLELGRNDAGERLGRYLRAFTGIAALRTANTRVDLRYPNGLAVRVALAKPADAGNKSTKKVTTKS